MTDKICSEFSLQGEFPDRVGDLSEFELQDFVILKFSLQSKFVHGSDSSKDLCQDPGF